jgi:hypothetical protein
MSNEIWLRLGMLGNVWEWTIMIWKCDGGGPDTLAWHRYRLRDRQNIIYRQFCRHIILFPSYFLPLPFISCASCLYSLRPFLPWIRQRFLLER